MSARPSKRKRDQLRAKLRAHDHAKLSRAERQALRANTRAFHLKHGGKPAAPLRANGPAYHALRKKITTAALSAIALELTPTEAQHVYALLAAQQRGKGHYPQGATGGKQPCQPGDSRGKKAPLSQRSEKLSTLNSQPSTLHSTARRREHTPDQRRAFVSTHRAGVSIRQVAARFHVPPSVVAAWVRRAANLPLERADFTTHAAGCVCPDNKIDALLENAIILARGDLRDAHLPHGPQAIRHHLLPTYRTRTPTARTIARVLARQGLVWGRK